MRVAYGPFRTLNNFACSWRSYAAKQLLGIRQAARLERLNIRYTSQTTSAESGHGMLSFHKMTTTTQPVSQPRRIPKRETRTPEQAHLDSFRLGTVWVASGEGSTWDELGRAFDSCMGLPVGRSFSPSSRTNLKLTGAPLTQTDRERWESGNVE